MQVANKETQELARKLNNPLAQHLESKSVNAIDSRANALALATLAKYGIVVHPDETKAVTWIEDNIDRLAYFPNFLCTLKTWFYESTEERVITDLEIGAYDEISFVQFANDRYDSSLASEIAYSLMQGEVDYQDEFCEWMLDIEWQDYCRGGYESDENVTCVVNSLNGEQIAFITIY